MSRSFWPRSRGSPARRPGSLLRLGALVGLTLAGCSTLSVSDERKLADEFELEVRQQYRFVGDPVVNDYVSRIGGEILRVAGPQPFQFQFSVLDEPEINAFAGPAGHIYVNSGTILKAANVSELAGVIAHEIGHVALRHIAQNYGKQQAAGIGQQVLVIGAGILGGSAAADAANLVGGAGLTAVLNSFGREAERQADDYAVHVLPLAGYDPHGLPTFFETLMAEGDAGGPKFLSDHPAPADRMQATRAAIDREELPPDLRVDDDGRLQIIQKRIQLLTETTPRSRRR